MIGLLSADPRLPIADQVCTLYGMGMMKWRKSFRLYEKSGFLLRQGEAKQCLIPPPPHLDNCPPRPARDMHPPLVFFIDSIPYIAYHYTMLLNLSSC